METNVLAGTRPGVVLDAALDGLLEKWNNRESNAAWQNWVGFGVSLDPDNPHIVYFTSDGVVSNNSPYLEVPFGHKREVINATFQAIPGREKKKQLLRDMGDTLTQPGDEIEGRANQEALSSNGTLGLFLNDVDGKRWALSANHVIAFNLQYEDVFVTLPETHLPVRKPLCIKVRQDSINPADAAVVECGATAEIDARIPRLLVGGVAAPRAPGAGAIVRKVGAATPIPTPGGLNYFAARVEVNQASNQIFGFNPCEFANQWIISGQPGMFAQSGDSGSLVVVQQGEQNFPLGLLIAVQTPSTVTSTALSIATPLQSILGGFNGKTFIIDPATFEPTGGLAIDPFRLSQAFGQHL